MLAQILRGGIASTLQDELKHLPGYLLVSFGGLDLHCYSLYVQTRSKNLS